MNGKIERSDLDGENRVILLKNKNKRYFALTFCSKLRKLYWIDFQTSEVYSMRYNNISNKKIIHFCLNLSFPLKKMLLVSLITILKKW